MTPSTGHCWAVLAPAASTVPDSDDPPPEPPDAAALDTIVSAWKVEGRPPPPEAAATVDAFAALLAIRGQIDFDDLVVGAVVALEADPQLLSRWHARFSHLSASTNSRMWTRRS